MCLASVGYPVGEDHLGEGGALLRAYHVRKAVAIKTYSVFGESEPQIIILVLELSDQRKAGATCQNDQVYILAISQRYGRCRLVANADLKAIPEPTTD